MAEKALQHAHLGQKVPEGIFETVNGGSASVEVKRIPSLNSASGEPLKSRIFPWRSTILKAADKAHDGIVSVYNTSVHHIVLCTLPSERVRRRVEHHAQKALREYLMSPTTRCVARRVHVHVLAVPLEILALV